MLTRLQRVIENQKDFLYVIPYPHNPHNYIIYISYMIEGIFGLGDGYGDMIHNSYPITPIPMTGCNQCPSLRV